MSRSPEQFRTTQREVFFRLTRVQFLPLIILPALLGAAFARYNTHSVNDVFLALTLAGVSLLHLGANAIDDCYDFQNGVDQVANSTFPADFGGWKPLPRRLISLRIAKLISYGLFASSLGFAAYLSYRVGIWAFVLGLLGVILAINYTAPPLKLDYRGLGLGELSIFFAFGPIPVLGSYYVQTSTITLSAFLISIPVGMMTVTILLYHDLIFYEVYRKANKISYAARLGRSAALRTSLLLTLLAYASIIALVAMGTLPRWSLAAPASSLLVLLRKRGGFARPNEPPPYYLPFTLNGLISNWVFASILVASLLI